MANFFDFCLALLKKLPRKFYIFALFILGICIILAILIYLSAPDLTKYKQRSFVLYDKQGELIYTSLNEQDYYRIYTTQEKVDPLYLKMLIATEDERFYYHFGVDPLSIIRALSSNLLAQKRVSGASTLAMQVCRMLEPKERVFWSKIKEALGAIYLTLVYGRDEVINMYLTLAPFGGNLEGVTAASYSYFRHSPQQLTPDEAALLVALPRSPEFMRPDRYPKRARYYRNEVLKKAVADQIIQEDILDFANQSQVFYQRQPLPNSAYFLGQSIFTHKINSPQLQAIQKQFLQDHQIFKTPSTTPAPLEFFPNKQNQDNSLQNNALKSETKKNEDRLTTSHLNHFRSLQDIARAESIDTNKASLSGLNQSMLPSEIYTTIDGRMQNELLSILDFAQQSYPYFALDSTGQRYSSTENMAVLVLDNRNFEVLAYAGSLSKEHGYVDLIQAVRSPGSALKPFAYAMAFEQGLIHPNSIIQDIPRLYGTYQPRNYERKFFGEISVANALRSSLNLPALEVTKAVGSYNFISRLNEIPNMPLPLSLSESLNMPSAIHTKKRVAEQSILETVEKTDKESELPKNKSFETNNLLKENQSTLTLKQEQALATHEKEHLLNKEQQEKVILSSAINTTQDQKQIIKQNLNNSYTNPNDYKPELNHISKANIENKSITSQKSKDYQQYQQIHQELQGSLELNTIYKEEYLKALNFFEQRGYIDGRIKLPANTDPSISLVLGGCGISLYDLTQLFAALANDGQALPLEFTFAPKSLNTIALNKNKHKDSKDYEDYANDADNTAHQSDEAYQLNQTYQTYQTNQRPQANKSTQNYYTLIEKPAARATYNILSKMRPPLGYDSRLRVSYKTGTSYKYRDALAIGSLGNLTVGVWVGRNDGSPASPYPGLVKAAPILFEVLTRLNEINLNNTDTHTLSALNLANLHFERDKEKEYLPNEGVLNNNPPASLKKIEIKQLGVVKKRRDNNTITQQQIFAKGNTLNSLNTLDPQQANINTYQEPLQIHFPINQSTLSIGSSQRVLLRYSGGIPPYYILVNDQIIAHEYTNTAQAPYFFEVKHNGIHNITIIDSLGNSKSIQVFIKGLTPQDK